MAADYRYVLDSSVAEDLLGLPLRQREQFIRIFRSLASDPYQKGDSFFRDASGREISKVRYGQWLVSFWADHAVNEVRIVGVQRTKR